MKFDNELADLKKTLDQTVLSGTHFTARQKQNIRAALGETSIFPKPKMIFPKVLSIAVSFIFLIGLGIFLKDSLDKQHVPSNQISLKEPQPSSTKSSNGAGSVPSNNLVPVDSKNQLKLDNLDDLYEKSNFEFIMPKLLPAGLVHYSGTVTLEGGKTNGWNERAEHGSVTRRQLTITENPGSASPIAGLNIEEEGEKVSIEGINGWIYQSEVRSGVPTVVFVKFTYQNKTVVMEAYNISKADVVKIAESIRK